jgi:hypothetical protein
MKLTTTFRDLISYETDEKTLQSIEKVTGSRTSYGIDTEIDFANLLGTVSLPVICGLMGLAREDSVALQHNISLELIKANVFIWEAKLGGAPINRLLDYCDAYLTAPTVDEERRDYCGDIIPGGGAADWKSRIIGQLDYLQGLTDAIDSSQSPKYSYSYWMKNGAPYDDSQLDWWQEHGSGRWIVDREHSNIIDPIININNVGNLPGYNPNVMIDNLLTIDPDTYLKQSESYDNVVVPNNTSYVTLIRVSWDESNGSLPDQGAEAARFLGNAAIACGFGIAYNTGNLSTIVSLIRSARTGYTTSARYPIAAQMARYQALSLQGVSVNSYSDDPAIQAAEKNIQQAGDEFRVNCLRNPDWIKQYDDDLDGKISSSERVTMEIAIRTGIKAARETVAKAAYDEAFTRYTALTAMDTEKPLVDIIQPYLL